MEDKHLLDFYKQAMKIVILNILLFYVLNVMLLHFFVHGIAIN